MAKSKIRYNFPGVPSSWFAVKAKEKTTQHIVPGKTDHHCSHGHDQSFLKREISHFKDHWLSCLLSCIVVHLIFHVIESFL